MKYAALCCYFGQWPTHFLFWLKSCSYNPGIHFFLVSDILVAGYEIPGNVHIIRESFAEVQARIAAKFQEIQVSVDRPYKLCDFKTAYGYIFEDLFAGYDYWGFFDIDTIWGNILKFVPENEDGHLLKIFPCGHLCFIRNQAPWNKVYELVNDVVGTPCRNNMEGKQVVTWQECFSSPESHYYDEEGGIEPMLEALEKQPSTLNPHPSTYTGVDFDNVLPPWRFDHFLSINFPGKSHHLVYSFDKGRLCRHYLQGCRICREEISYLHASKRRFRIAATDTTRFVIYPSKVAAFREWTLPGLLLHGRKRRLKNLLKRICNRFRR